MVLSATRVEAPVLSHAKALVGDRLVDGEHEAIEIEKLGNDRQRGYSDALGLYVCWEEGILRFFDPVSESYLDTHEEDRAGRIAAEDRAGAAEARAEEERVDRMAAEARAREEATARGTAEARAGTAEARVAELEEELRRLRGE